MNEILQAPLERRALRAYLCVDLVPGGRQRIPRQILRPTHGRNAGEESIESVFTRGNASVLRVFRERAQYLQVGASEAPPEAQAGIELRRELATRQQEQSGSGSPGERSADAPDRGSREL